MIRFLWLEGVSEAAIHQRLLAQYGNSVFPQWSVYEWTEKLKTGRTNVHHDKGARRLSTAITEINRACMWHGSVRRCGNTLFPYCAESLWWITAPDTPSDQKNRITEHWFPLVHTESGAAMINGKAATMELTYQHQTCAEIMIMRPHTHHLRNTTNAVNRNTSTTALRIIIDLPSYKRII